MQIPSRCANVCVYMEIYQPNQCQPHLLNIYFYCPISSIFLPPILLFNCKFPNDSDKCLKSHLIIRGTFEMCGTWKIGTREASAMYCPQGIAMLLQKCNIWLLLAISPLGRKILCQYSHLVKI